MSLTNGQLAFTGLGSNQGAGGYVRRDPESSVLYQVVAKNLNTFLQATELMGKTLPKHVTDEFDAYLRCGVLAYGFLRLQCENCKHERIVGFSCKKRGICSSCGGRRMAETAAHLLDHVFPKVGIRQWVVSFPFPIRYLLARDSKIQSKCLEIILRAITTFLKKKVKKQGAKGKLQAGAVTLIQRFGGSVNLNPHAHMLILDGAYDIKDDGKRPRFHWIQTLTDDDVKAMVKIIAIRVIKYLQRQGHFRDDGPSLADNEGSDDELLPELQAASVQSKIAMGQRKGQPVRRLGSWGMIIDENPHSTAPLCATIQGFSLHAGVYCAPWEREKLEKLCRYVSRPAIAEDRLRVLPSGEIVYKLKRDYSDGTSHLIFTPLEFMEKLAALVPKPRVHLTRFHGILAPHAKIRSLIVPKKEEPVAEKTQAAPPGDNTPSKKKQRMGWAELLSRVFAIDMKNCPSCGAGELKPIAAILETKVVVKILDHMGLPSKPPDIASANFNLAVDYCKA